MLILGFLHEYMDEKKRLETEVNFYRDKPRPVGCEKEVESLWDLLLLKASDEECIRWKRLQDKEDWILYWPDPLLVCINLGRRMWETLHIPWWLWIVISVLMSFVFIIVILKRIV